MNKIEKIVYINLKKREDRNEQIKNELKNFDYTRFEGIEHTSGIIGCGLSHLSVLKMAKECKWKNILIFEDDFMFLVSPEEFEKQLDQFFNSKIDYNVLMLSYNLQQGSLCNDFLGKVIEAQTTSGYLIHEKYYDTLIKCWEEGLELLIQTGQHWNYALDQYWKKLQHDNWYYFLTRIGKQRDGYSDNSCMFVSYDC